MAASTRTAHVHLGLGLGLAVALLAGCDNGPHPVTRRPDGAAGFDSGATGSGGGSGGSRDASGSGGSGGGSGGSGGGSGGSGGGSGGSGGGSGGSGGFGGSGGSGGSGGIDASTFDAPDAGETGDAPQDIGADAPTADAPDVPADAPAEVAVDVPPTTDARVPDGGFRYPNPDGRLCGNSRHTLGKTAAEIMIVLDRSGSMAGFTTFPRTRWDDARDAVYDAVLANQNFAWGVKLFPMGPGSCTINPGVEVPVAFGNGPAIQGAIDPAGPPGGVLGNGTPTDKAVIGTAAYLKTVTTPLPKYLLLVTDGAPTCAMDGPSTRNEAATLTAITDAATAGFKTFVIGIATATMDIDTLNKMADAGGTARAGATHYYPASDRPQLDAAFQAITRAVTTCIFPLVTRPLDPEFVSVTAGSMLIPRDVFRIEGWDYIMNETAIQVHGSVCESLKMGQTMNVGVHFGCPN